MLFKSTDFGDDKDRALQKSDKSWTYFAYDVAYHNTKLKRNFDTLINILGADHAGYIKRISSAVVRPCNILLTPSLRKVTIFSFRTA